ncbi:cytochrome c-type biogenesis protein CcmH [Micromonospora polyrhachis]|uniref:Cytochrome c-type biogenesis protein n=1 Tax=Micromonospora polyrhachis TaxID=1282883 RepID=A0A7W7WSY5_9ACTN|nr:cytochrome c-type biogenesis protein [Micromonospora polyrhachis]MBB4962539.1 cytochrome c-type biogenesis protein CcmH/NrfF [Micromonospora polyrhachis]
MAGTAGGAAVGDVTLRRVCAVALLVVLLAGAGLATWRSTGGATASDPVRDLAAGLRCPACQGESVADSRSPIAAAMREVVAAQLAEGRSPDEVRAYFAERYGPEVLATPPARGLGLLLWVVPALVLLTVAVAAMRTHRRSERHRSPAPRSDQPAGRLRVRARTTWNVGALSLVGFVGVIAVIAPPGSEPAPPASAVTDPVAAQLTLARSLEQRGEYATAADVYRTALAQRPVDDIRLRLAFTLVRAGQPTPAEEAARQVLAGRPDEPDALLILGLAQRASGRPAAGSTLRRFLTLAPDHPAAPEVRRLLDAR